MSWQTSAEDTCSDCVVPTPHYTVSMENSSIALQMILADIAILIVIDLLVNIFNFTWNVWSGQTASCVPSCRAEHWKAASAFNTIFHISSFAPSCDCTEHMTSPFLRCVSFYYWNVQGPFEKKKTARVECNEVRHNATGALKWPCFITWVQEQPTRERLCWDTSELWKFEVSIIHTSPSLHVDMFRIWAQENTGHFIDWCVTVDRAKELLLKM